VSLPRLRLSEEWQTFWLAISFLTRLPVLINIDYSPRLMSNSSTYFPLVGLLLGIIYAAAYSVLEIMFSPLVAVLLVMVLHLWLTGAFHEDGLADSLDGLGGGYTLEDRLRIMKDSQIGTYGVIALVMALLLKAALLVESQVTWLALLIAPCISRLTPLLLMRWLPYITGKKTSKTGPVANAFPTERLLPAVLFTVLVIALGSFWLQALAPLALAATLGVALIWGSYLKRQLGGHTGDSLGACVVFSELVLLAGLV